MPSVILLFDHLSLFFFLFSLFFLLEPYTTRLRKKNKQKHRKESEEIWGKIHQKARILFSQNILIFICSSLFFLSSINAVRGSPIPIYKKKIKSQQRAEQIFIIVLFAGSFFSLCYLYYFGLSKSCCNNLSKFSLLKITQEVHRKTVQTVLICSSHSNLYIIRSLQSKTIMWKCDFILKNSKKIHKNMYETTYYLFYGDEQLQVFRSNKNWTTTFYSTWLFLFGCEYVISCSIKWESSTKK